MTPRAADVLVIGAGIVGAFCARTLAERGLRVTVLDAGLPGATAAGMGHLLVLDDDPAEFALSQYSLQRWRALASKLPEACAYRANGTLWLAANAEELAIAEGKCQALKDAGEAAEMLDAKALHDHEPQLRTGLAGALRLPGDGIVYAPRVAAWLLEHPRIQQRRARVLALEEPQVQLADGSRLSAGAIVLANGIQAPQLCPELPITPKKGHVLITDRYPGRVKHTLTELAYLTSVHNASGPSVALNIQPRPTGQLFIGTSRQFDTFDPAVEPWLLGRLLRRAVDYMPALTELNAIRAWTGLRAATPDGQPIIGEHPQRPGLWLAVGHEGLGVTAAPATADLLAAALFDEPAPLPAAAFRAERYLGDSAYA